MDKSFVSLEKHICAVCGKAFDTGAILLDRRLRPSMEPCTVTDYGLCPEHLKLFNEDYIALVEIDPERSDVGPEDDRIKPQDVYRTGKFAHLRKHVFTHLFDAPIQDKQAFIYVDPEVFQHLERLHANSLES